MFAALIVVHVIICLALMLVVLMQSAKGEGLAGALGGGGGISGAVFGGRGAATFLSKATTVLAILFMFSCIGLTFLSRGTAATQVGESAVERLAGQQQQNTPAPAQPTQVVPTTTGQPNTQQPAAGGQQGTQQPTTTNQQPTSTNQQNSQQPPKTSGGGK